MAMPATRSWWFEKESRSCATLPCTFTVKGLDFDLCQLFDITSPFRFSIDEDTPPTHTRRLYAISLGQPLKRDPTLPAALQCPNGTHVCLTVVNTRPDHPSEPERITRVVPIGGGLSEPRVFLGETPDGQQHAPLVYVVEGLDYASVKQQTVISLTCDESASINVSPTLLHEANGIHVFAWNSKHACHRALPNPSPDPTPVDDPPPPSSPAPSRPQDGFLFTSLASNIAIGLAVFAILFVMGIHFRDKKILRMPRKLMRKVRAKLRKRPPPLALSGSALSSREDMPLAPSPGYSSPTYGSLGSSS